VRPIRPNGTGAMMRNVALWCMVVCGRLSAPPDAVRNAVTRAVPERSRSPVAFAQVSQDPVETDTTTTEAEITEPADLTELLAMLDQIQTEVQEVELATTALDTKVQLAQGQIDQNAVSLSEAYTALHSLEAQKAANVVAIQGLTGSSVALMHNLGVQSGDVANVSSQLNTLELNLAALGPRSGDVVETAKNITIAVDEKIPVLDGVEGRLDAVEEEIGAIEAKVKEGVDGAVKADMDNMVLDVKSQVSDLNDAVKQGGIPARLQVQA